MSKERETLITDLSINAGDGFFYITQKLQAEIRELLAQHEQNKPAAIMPNGVCVSNVYDAYEEGRKSVMSEQEPVAWIIETEIYGKLSEWVCMDKKHYMEEHDSIKEPIPLYLAPQTREPLINEQKSAEAELEQALKDTIDGERIRQIFINCIHSIKVEN